MTLLSCVSLCAAAFQSPNYVAVPFRIADHAIVVDATLNGHDVSLMFDSGFGGTVLLDGNIDVGPETGSMTLRDFVGELHVGTVALKSLKLGSLTLNPDEKQIVKQPANFSAQYGRHVDGILGLASIKDRVTEINFENKQFRFYPANTDISTKSPDNKKTFLTKMLPIGGNAIELPVSTEKGKYLTMALDTGNSFYATTHKDVLERVGLWSDSQTPNFVRQSGVASGAVDSWSYRMPNLNIFGVPVKPTIWDVIDLPSSDARGDGTVGFGFLNNFNIIFDFSRRRVWLENWKTPIENPEVGEVGLSAHYDPEAKKVYVVLVAPGSPAEKAGIKVGDEVLSIGGTDLDHPNFRQIRDLIEGPVGSEIEIDASRDGNLKRFKMLRASLVN